MEKEKRFIIIILLVGIVALAGIVGFIGSGNIRHVQIFWQETVKQTVAFQDTDDGAKIIGITGIQGENPELISRTGFAYLLTVVNQGDKHHRLYIEGLEIQTDLLAPGENQTLTIYPTEEGTYNYYDKRQFLEKLGQIKILTVVPSDGFQGIWKDLI